MIGGICALQSPAASGILHEIENMPTWLRPNTSLRPLYIPDSFEDRQIPRLLTTYISLAEYFRVVVVPQQSGDWKRQLPRVPVTTEELKGMLAKRQEGDELAIMQQLTGTGSVSASIATCLGLTRAVVAEAYNALRDSREEQHKLTDILGATRFKTQHNGKMHRVKCPKRYCFSQDSFQHLLECYNLKDDVSEGPEAVPFLVKLAKRTKRPKGKIPVPEKVTAATRKRDADQLVAMLRQIRKTN